jgi:hypothetical protein
LEGSSSTYIDLICASFDNSITQFSFPLQNRDLSVDYRIRSDGMQLKPPRADRLTIRILLIFRLAFGGAEGRHSRTESRRESVECALVGISSSTQPSAPTQDSAGRRSINWLYLFDHGIEICQGRPDFAGGSPDSGEHRQTNAQKTPRPPPGPEHVQFEGRMDLESDPCPATGSEFV